MFSLATALAGANEALAQRSFLDVSEGAAEVPGDLSRFAGALFNTCESANAAQRERCQRLARRDARAIMATSWLVSMPAAGHVEVGPYEHVREGFIIRVPGFTAQAFGGVISTQPFTDGQMPHHILAERFIVVHPHDMERWFRANSVDRLKMRMVFRFVRPWQDGDRRGYAIEVDAVQVYNDGNGSVILDSLRAEVVPGGPQQLTGRVLLWDRLTVGEARWRSPSGIPILFTVRVEPGEGDTRTPVLLETRGVATSEVGRFVAPYEESNLALIPRGDRGVLVVFTESRPAPGRPGRGRVQLLEWRSGNLVRVAEWTGTNEETPPAWVTDPRAPLP